MHAFEAINDPEVLKLMARDRFYDEFKFSLYLIALSRYVMLLLFTSSVVYLMGKAMKIQDLTFGDALMG
jgi:hypothetical protein